ncbi:hypothetical protein HGO21_30145 [Acinetobacter sp. CUI P1]|nr:hypothetical protein [Acinetobacter sp. CUI P1]
MNLEAQRAVLGALLKDPELMDDCYLKKDDFSEEEHNRKIFTVLQYAKEHFKEASNPFDMVLIANKWGKNLQQIGGISHFVKLRESAPHASNFAYYQKAVRVDRVQADLVELGKQIATSGGDVTEIQAKVLELAELQQADNETGPIHMASILEGHGQTVAKRASSGGITGAKMANEEIAQLSGGHQKGDLEIVAARPSIGKTQYVINDMDAVTKDGWAAVLFSLEMSSLKVVERMVSTIGGIKNKKIKSGLMSDNDWDSYSKAVEIIANRNLFIDDTHGATVEYIRRQVKALKKKYPNLVVYIDYLQFIETEKSFTKNTEKIGYITKALKGIAKEFDVCVVAISAVGRDCEKRPDKRPMMSDLRESGNIESDADVVTFLYRDDYYNADTPKKGIVEFIVAKGRDIGTGTFEMAFLMDIGRFVNLTTDDKYKLAEKVKAYEQQRKNNR